MVQRSFKVDGEKITIKRNVSTHMGNAVAQVYDINGDKFRFPILTDTDVAEETAFKMWMDKNL